MEKGCVSVSVPCHWIPFPPPGLLGGASVGEEEVLSPTETGCLRAGGYPRGTASLRRGGSSGGGRERKGEIREERRGREGERERT